MANEFDYGAGGRRLADEIRGLGDVAWTMGKHAAIQPVAGYKGLAALLRGRGLDEATREIEETQALAGGPSTAEGARNLEKAGKAIEYVTAPLTKAVDVVGEYSPAAGAALTAAGAVIDPTKVTKALRGARAATKAAKAIKTVEAPSVRQALEGAVEQAEPPVRQALPPEEALAGFGEAKAKREAATAKRLKQQEASDVVVERQKGGGRREKTQADVYRKLYGEEGPEAVLKEAEAGKHLKPQPGGGYVGAPRTVQTGPQLGAMRKSLDEQFGRGINALEYADPFRVGTWYDRAKAGQAATAEPWQLPRTLESHGVYSAGVSPESELAFALKHWNSRALGTNERAYRGAGAETLDKAVREDKPARLSFKVGEYASKNDPRVVESSPFGVNDFRMAQAFGYTDPAGNPWRAGASPTMHPFMDAETALAVQRANERAVGQRTDWTGARMQEIPWILNKAEDIYGRGKRGRFQGGYEGMGKALREANATMADYLPKHTMAATYEYVPGQATGHVPQLLEAPLEAKRAYGERGRWDTPTPMSAAEAGMPESVGAGNRDAIYRALGLRQQPTRQGEGLYLNRAGEVEKNPLGIAQPLVDFSTGTVAQVNPKTMATLEAAERFRGLMDAQEAAAANLPVTMASRKGRTGLLLENPNLPTSEQLADVGSLLEGTQYAVAPHPRGINLIAPGWESPEYQQHVQRFAGQMAEQMRGAYPGTTGITRAGNEGLYLPDVTTSAAEAGQGIATRKALEAWAGAPEQAARNVSESPEVRSAITAKMARDVEAGGGREDIARSREFFSEADWSKVVDAIRRGVPPAAAVAAAGYSLEGMAAERER